MTHDELVEKVARSIEDVSIMCDTYCLSDEDSINVAKAAIATIRAALQEPTPKALDSAVAFALNVHISIEYKWTSYMTDVWGKMLAASPLGEQSE